MKIRDFNPHCLFVKTVCHSIALAVSHASKGVEFKPDFCEIYGYFADSKKRHRKFQEFLKFFIYKKNHKILQHSEIRWFSLHACISRIIEQWDPLILYFRLQYLKHKDMSFEFYSKVLRIISLNFTSIL